MNSAGRWRAPASVGALSGRRSTLAVVAAVALFATTVASAWAVGRAGRPTGQDGVSATTGAGRALPADPRLNPGTHVVISVTGFAPATTVTVGLVGTAVLGTAPADRNGELSYRYTVPRISPDGEHALVFVGRPRAASKRHGAGNLVVTAPLARSWRFRTPAAPTSGGGVPGGSPSGGVSAGASPPGSGDHGAAGAAATSQTGTDVLTLLAAAALAVLAGIVLLVATRRRDRR